jgi:hypothetical protein
VSSLEITTERQKKDYLDYEEEEEKFMFVVREQKSKRDEFFWT